MMAIVSGAVCILAGIARLGFVTELLSKPIRYGYMNEIALAVLVSQTPKLFGVKVEKAGPLRDIWSIAVEIAGGRMNWTEFALGAATLAVIFSIKTFKGLPGILLAVEGSATIEEVFDLETRGSRAQCSAPLHLGPPRFRIPRVGVRTATVALGGLAAALVSFADSEADRNELWAGGETSGPFVSIRLQGYSPISFGDAATSTLGNIPCLLMQIFH